MIDQKFAQWLGLQLPDSSQSQLLLSAILSCELGDGHVCIELDNLAQIIAHWPDPLKAIAQSLLLAEHVSDSALLDQLLVGDGSKLTPLVIDNRRLYLLSLLALRMQSRREIVGNINPQQSASSCGISKNATGQIF